MEAPLFRLRLLVASVLTVALASPAAAQNCSSMNPKDWPAPAKPYFLIITDSSGGMSNAVNVNNACAYPNDRLGHVRCALSRFFQAHGGEAQVGLASFSRRMLNCTGATCYTGCTYGNLSGNSAVGADPVSCANGAGCGAEPDTTAVNSSTRAGLNILVPIPKDTAPPSADNTAELMSWVDNDCTGSKELFANGCSPTNGALRDAYRYFSSQWVPPTPTPGGATLVSPLTSVASGERACRVVNVILIIEGNENCDKVLEAVDAAADLLAGFTKNGITWQVKTHVIDIGPGLSSIPDQIAAAGGTTAAVNAADDTKMLAALTTILTDALPAETCDNLDNNCNGCTDEGFRHFANLGPTCCAWTSTTERNTCLTTYNATITSTNPRGDGAKLPCTTQTQQLDPLSWLCIDPEICDNVDNNGDGLTDEGARRCGNPLHCPSPEVCNNGIDDNCDGLIDENCAPCIPQPEVCDGCDNDCDGVADNGLGTTGSCGYAVPSNCAGTFGCKPPQNVPVGTCTTTGGPLACSTSPQPESCDGLDNDCNGVTDDIVSTSCFTTPNLVYGGKSTCRLGNTLCANGVPSCAGFLGPTAETCDGLDNDCNGVVDDGAQDVGLPCGRVGGACTAGITACVNGRLECQGGKVPTAESCDGMDNDCDGETDELNPTCGSGLRCVRFQGVYQCVAPCACGSSTCGPSEVCADVSSSGLALERTCVVLPDLGVVPDLRVPPDLSVKDLTAAAAADQATEGADLSTPVGVPVSGCGCHVGARPGGDGNATAAWAILLAGLGLLGRRRLRSSSLLVATIALLLVAGCNSRGNQSQAAGGAQGGMADGGACLPASPCVPTNNGVEICDGVDNDCNGETDTVAGQPTADATGACNPWATPPSGATSPCTAGTRACIGGLVVCQGAVGPTLQADTCGVDANCDGVLTGQPDHSNDIKNCGTCGKDCLAGALHADWSCVQGQCRFLGCQTGFVDLDGDRRCEYPCTYTSAGESCNGLDDNCNGLTDENLIVPLPSQVCGTMPAATRPECTTAVTVACQGGKWACTFPAGVCNPSCAAATEVCDTLDNNCNGLLNENVPLYGKACASDDGTPGTGDPRCRTTGVYACNGPSAVACSAPAVDCNTLPGGCTELCDGIDNDCDGLTDETFNAKGTNATFFVKPSVVKILANRWIYAYEASRPSADGTTAGLGDGYFTSAPVGKTIDKTPACSRQGVLPWSGVAPGEADQTCTAMGGFLCAPADWTTACQATAACSWGYGPRGAACTSTYSSGKFCNLGPSFDFDASASGDQDGLLVTGSTSLAGCGADWGGLLGNASNVKVFDITGNLREIVRVSSSSYFTAGGAFDTIDPNGATCTTTSTYPVDVNYRGRSTGFRCCFSSDPTQ